MSTQIIFTNKKSLKSDRKDGKRQNLMDGNSQIVNAVAKTKKHVQVMNLDHLALAAPAITHSS